MIIQKLIGPSKEVCNEWGMYFRKVDKEGNDITTYPYDDGDVMFHKLIDGVKASEVAAESFPLEIKQGEILSLDTYFNAFSIGKCIFIAFVFIFSRCLFLSVRCSAA